jgi:chemotaxis signal transduction protein
MYDMAPNIRNMSPSNISPSLDDLIMNLDHQLAQVPHPFEAEGFDAFLGSQLGVFKKRGRQYVRFQLGPFQFALPLENAIEIGNKPDITPLPNLPEWVFGICNLRGDIISVVDLSQILQLPYDNTSTLPYTAIIRDQHITTAILVEKIIGVFFDGDFESLAQAKSKETEPFSVYVQDSFASHQETIHLLNVQALMAALEIAPKT